MRRQLDIQGKSQFDPDIRAAYRPSACGPVTAFIMLNHHFPSLHPYDVNELYRLLGGTKIGLFKWRFIRNMRKLLGTKWIVKECSIAEVKRQIDSGWIVAAKFDKWFNFRWRGGYAYDYHWVPVIGYEEVVNDLLLIIHDNGGRHRPSQIRRVSYHQNRPVLSFVKIEPRT